MSTALCPSRNDTRPRIFPGGIHSPRGLAGFEGPGRERSRFAKPDVQKKWWSLGGYSCHNAVLGDPGFADTAPFAADFLKAMSGVKDFWQEPAYASLMQSMQKRVHDYVVADRGTAQEALDKMIEDWIETFEDEGKL